MLLEFVGPQLEFLINRIVRGEENVEKEGVCLVGYFDLKPRFLVDVITVQRPILKPLYSCSLPVKVLVLFFHSLMKMGCIPEVSVPIVFEWIGYRLGSFVICQGRTPPFATSPLSRSNPRPYFNPRRLMVPGRRSLATEDESSGYTSASCRSTNASLSDECLRTSSSSQRVEVF